MIITKKRTDILWVRTGSGKNSSRTQGGKAPDPGSATLSQSLWRVSAKVTYYGT
jgi:hypothetical protein